MKLPARKIAALCLLLANNAASATVVTLPSSGAYERQLFNNLNVYPLDSQSACASDPGCQQLTGTLTGSSSGQLTGQAIVPAPANGMGHVTSSFTAGSTVGDVLLSPAGSQSTTYPAVPTYVIDAADKFASDDDLKWKVKLRLLQTYTSMRALVSLIDLNQDNAGDARNIASVQHHALGAPGAHAGYTAGGTATDLSGVCVTRDGSYNTVGASTQKDCPAGSLYVSAKRSASMAEYAAFAQSVSNPARSAASANFLHSADLRYAHSDPGSKQFRQCGECDLDQSSGLEPGLLLKVLGWIKDPTSMLLLALAGVAALVVDAVAKARRA